MPAVLPAAIVTDALDDSVRAFAGEFPGKDALGVVNQRMGLSWAIVTASRRQS
jgi:hypothetical protein